MIIKNQCLHPISVPKITGTTARILRCGWCPNCLRQKKNELVVRTVREVQGKSIAFLTFTYRPEDCPIQVTDLIVDKETGEYIEKSHIIRDSDLNFHTNAPFEWRLNKNCKRSKRYKPLFSETDYGFSYQYYTVNYVDIQLALKRFRIKHPGALETFICVGEYGSVTYRPHYHMLVVGMSDSEINDLVDEWQYGDVYTDLCNTKGKSNDPMKIASYIAKYCVKGKYDCNYIKEGKCQKPRRCSSKGYGCGTIEQFNQLKTNLLGGDFCHCPDPWVTDDLPLSAKQLSYMASQRKYMINDYVYPMPKYLVNKVFKKTFKVVKYVDDQFNKRCFIREHKSNDSEFKNLVSCLRKEKRLLSVTYHQVSSPVQKQITHQLLSILVSDTLRQQAKDKRIYTNYDLFIECQTDISNDEKNTIDDVEKHFISDLERSSIY